MGGFQIDTKLNHHDHIDNLLAKVRLRLFMFRRIASTAGLRARLMYGHGLVFSCFLYCISLYGSSDKSYLRKVSSLYNKCIRKIAGPEYRNKNTAEISAALNIFSFEQARQYFDIVTFHKIVNTQQPVHLHQQIQFDYQRETRGTSNGQLRIHGVPKTEKMKRSFMYRACSEYNRTPWDLRQLGGHQHKKFKDCVKRWILGYPYVLTDNRNLFNNNIDTVGVG